MIAPLEPSWRKPVGVFIIMGLIVLWAVLVVSIAERLGDIAWPIELLFYIVAGLLWILPLKPLLRWMETGRWR